MNEIPKILTIHRLNRLADFLDTLPPERFDYSRFVGDDWAGAQDLSCGTTACALGWACTRPEFQKLGLRLVMNDSGVFPMGMPQCGNYTWQHAAEPVFGITEDDATYLFLSDEHHQDIDYDAVSPSGDASARDVAEHIRNFVEHIRENR